MIILLARKYTIPIERPVCARGNEGNFATS